METGVEQEKSATGASSDADAPPPAGDDAIQSGAAAVRPDFRAGFVALCGRPNVGKSTLLNALLGTELAVASKLPQTTRERMLGVWTTDTFQAVLVDTPGIHRARSALNSYMVDEALRGARDVDLILMLAEIPIVSDEETASKWEPGPGALAVLEALNKTGRPIGLVLTKLDRLPSSDLLLPIIHAWTQRSPFAFVVPTSAREQVGLERLSSELLKFLPQSPPLYDDDQLSDRAMRWHAGERVRAAIFATLSQELPYSCAVTIESFKERPDKDVIKAAIHVERESQKPILIGRKGKTVKTISTRARADIARFTGRPCDLFVTIKVTRNWTKKPELLEKLGYHDPVGGES